MKLNLFTRLKNQTLTRDILGKLGFKNTRKIHKILFIKILNLISVKIKTINFGSQYGNWDFIHSDNLKNSIFISAGCGEDISFDIEFLNTYGGRVILVDPTPRSIQHIKDVIKNLGSKKTLEYYKGGKQSIETYDLFTITSNQLVLEELALYDKSDLTVKFYPPYNEDHVSYSISNIQNVKEDHLNILSVKTVSLKDLMLKYKIESLNLLKLDIEGAAENNVLPSLLIEKILPEQILVEFDDLHFKNTISHIKAVILILKFLFSGYVLIKTNYFHNILLVKKHLIN